MIVIHIGILMYPVKDSAEGGLVFSKYSLKKKIGGGKFQIN